MAKLQIFFDKKFKNKKNYEMGRTLIFNKRSEIFYFILRILFYI